MFGAIARTFEEGLSNKSRHHKSFVTSIDIFFEDCRAQVKLGFYPDLQHRIASYGILYVVTLYKVITLLNK